MRILKQALKLPLTNIYCYISYFLALAIFLIGGKSNYVALISLMLVVYFINAMYFYISIGIHEAALGIVLDKHFKHLEKEEKEEKE